MTIFGELFDRQLYVAAQRFGPALHLDLLALLGRVGEVLLFTDLGGIDGALHAAQPDPDLLVLAARMIRHIDRKYLRLLLVRKTQQGLDGVEAVHEFALVEQDFAIAVVDDRLLHDGRRDDVLHLLRDRHHLAEVLADGLV